MAFTESWVETEPDGSVITVSVLDDSDRLIKRAVRERLEGDPSNPNSGIYEAGTFGSTAIVRAGTARAYYIAEASLSTLTKQDGRLAFSSDTNKLFHLKASGITEIAYVNLDGNRAMTGSLKMGNNKITGLAAGTANTDAVRYDQVAVLDQSRIINGLWAFDRATGAPPFLVIKPDAAVVENLDADKLDGLHASAFATAGHNHDSSYLKLAGGDLTGVLKTNSQIQSTVATGTAPFTVVSQTVVANLNASLLQGNAASAFATAVHKHNASDIDNGILAVNRGGTGRDSYTAGALLFSDGVASIGNLPAGQPYQTLSGELAWGGNVVKAKKLAATFTTSSGVLVATGLYLDVKGGEEWLIEWRPIVSVSTVDSAALGISYPTGSTGNASWIAMFDNPGSLRGGYGPISSAFSGFTNSAGPAIYQTQIVVGANGKVELMLSTNGAPASLIAGSFFKATRIA